jgi:hypothetical protein
VGLGRRHKCVCSTVNVQSHFHTAPRGPGITAYGAPWPGFYWKGPGSEPFSLSYLRPSHLPQEEVWIGYAERVGLPGHGAGSFRKTLTPPQVATWVRALSRSSESPCTYGTGVPAERALLFPGGHLLHWEPLPPRGCGLGEGSLKPIASEYAGALVLAVRSWQVLGEVLKRQRRKEQCLCVLPGFLRLMTRGASSDS